MQKNQKFDRNYFRTNLYKKTEFDKKFTMYWWSCRFYANLIRRYIDSGKILDIGCGLGHVLRRLSDDFETIGIDVNRWAIDQCRENSPKSKFLVLPAEKIDRLKGKFDIVLMRHLIEHLVEPEDVLEKVSRIIKKGGFLIIATPNPEGLMAKKLKEKWVNFKDPTHISIKRLSEWKNILEGLGFEIKLEISDGFWAAPYLPIIPTFLQKVVFGFLGGLQAVTGFVSLPPNWGENLILIAEKIGNEKRKERRN